MTTMELLSNYWHFNIFIVLGSLLLLLIHLVGNRFKLNGQSLLFFAGLLLFLITTLSPLSFLAESYLFSAHMIKHITLLLIVPALLLAGMNGDFLKRIITKKAVKGIANVLFYPFVAWFCGVGAMWLWHIPSLLHSVMTSPSLKVIHLISLLILGFIFNWPVFSPVAWRKISPLQSVLYLFTACVGCTILGILITFAPAGLYTQYFIGSNKTIIDLLHQNWGISAATDQQAGGLIMWVPACIIYVTDSLITLAKWYRTPATIDSESVK